MGQSYGLLYSSRILNQDETVYFEALIFCSISPSNSILRNYIVEQSLSSTHTSSRPSRVEMFTWHHNSQAPTLPAWGTRGETRDPRKFTPPSSDCAILSPREFANWGSISAIASSPVRGTYNWCIQSDLYNTAIDNSMLNLSLSIPYDSPDNPAN
jgi:hypothetical protein